MLNTDGSGSLSTTAQTMPADGSGPVVTNVNYQLLSPRSGAIDAIRAGNGMPYAGLGLLSLDGTNAISGSERVETVGVNAVNNVTGNYAVGSDLFGSLTLNTPFSDMDGNVSYSTANYVFVAGVDQVIAIRTGANSAAVSTLSARQPAPSMQEVLIS